MEPTYGDFEMDDVEGIEELKSRMEEAETVRDWSFILSDYISFGNPQEHFCFQHEFGN